MQSELESFKAFLALGIFCTALTIITALIYEFAKDKYRARRNRRAMSEQIEN